jgi:hypothetical protein
MRALRFFTILIFCSVALQTGVFAQTGKVDGTVTDARTGQSLVGVNVIIEGTMMGAATNLDGYYAILNVPPGSHIMRISMIGYDPVRVEDVYVSINQTTTIDVQLREATLELEEVVIVAERPIVQRDVSASTANISAQEIQNLPVVSVTSVVSLQAGIQGLSFRGSSLANDPVAFMVNGYTMRDERDNTPYTSVSYTSVQEIQIQTGGFNAEYGNVRSGVVNVITREGSREFYTLDVISRYSPPRQKHFGIHANDANAYWIRPYVDSDVAWTGTKAGGWDEWTQRQYPEFEGWIAVSEQTMQDGNPDTDLSPEAAQQLFLWQHRKPLKITRPDYDVDVSVSGPLPAISSKLGNARFLASYRETEEMYMIPLHTDSYKDYSGQLKITTDLGTGMKLMVEGMYGRSSGTNDNNSGLPGIFRSPASIAGVMHRVSYIDTRIFTTDYWAPSQITRHMAGARFTHSPSPRTFYEVSLQQFTSDYDTNPGRLRDDSTMVRRFGNNYWVDEAPYGFQPGPSFGIAGMRMGVGMSGSRDSSMVTIYTGKFDITSQVSRINQIKAGIEVNVTDSKVNYAQYDAFLPTGNVHSKWNTTPFRGALYAQNKLEFEGMVANVGVRVEYSHAGGEWYVYDPFTRAFSSAQSGGLDTLLEMESTERILNVSPRLGVSFPVTENSKLYFNYGHFRAMPTPENLYLLRRSGETNAIVRLANPNNPLQKTVAYELGYEHNLFDMFLVRIAGYYRDISNQPRLVRYTNFNSTVNYQVTEPLNYQDTRGFEITLQKRVGRWFSGFVNYTYMVSSTGNFGFGQIFENPFEMRRYERENRLHYQTRPVPEPYARLNLDMYTPPDYGPEFAGVHFLGDWRLNILATWQAGFYFTWTGGGAIPGIENNVQWRDSYGTDIRLSKNFSFLGANVQFFMDVYNVFNIKRMSANRFNLGYGFFDGRDYNFYMESLHLPAHIGDPLGYGNIPGNDRPGDYRKPGIEFHPIVSTTSVTQVTNPHSRPLYYESSTQRYMQYVNGQWVVADQSTVDRVLDNKAYIDMPNQEYLTFLNPRNIFWGLRISLTI